MRLSKKKTAVAVAGVVALVAVGGGAYAWIQVKGFGGGTANAIDANDVGDVTNITLTLPSGTVLTPGKAETLTWGGTASNPNAFTVDAVIGTPVITTNKAAECAAQFTLANVPEKVQVAADDMVVAPTPATTITWDAQASSNECLGATVTIALTGTVKS